MIFNDPSELAKYAEPDPEFVELMSAHPPPPVDTTDITSFIAAVDKLQADARSFNPPCPPSSVEETDHFYYNRHGTPLRYRMYRRPNSPPGPLIIHYHGGGGCVGTPEDEARPARDLVRAFNAVCLTPQYRLAPQHPFPAGIEDAWDFLSFAASNAESFPINSSPSSGFILSGISQGALFCSVLSHLSISKSLSPQLTGIHLSCGALLGASSSLCPEKYSAFHQSPHLNTDPILTIEGYRAFQRAYGTHSLDPSSPNAPLHYPTLGLSPSLPRHFIQAAGLDLLRDDSVVYSLLLRDLGVETRLEVYEGVPHAWFAFCSGLEVSRRYRKEFLEGVGEMLGRRAECGSLE